MKNTKKKALTIVMVMALFFTFVLPVVVQADSVEAPLVPPAKPPTDETLTSLAGTVIGYAQWLGIIVAVVMIIFYGVRYFTAAPDKQADLKKAIWGYLIGAACIFGASIILGFIGKSLVNASENFDTK